MKDRRGRKAKRAKGGGAHAQQGTETHKEAFDRGYRTGFAERGMPEYAPSVTDAELKAKPQVFFPADLLTPKELHARLKVGPTWLYEQLRKPASKRPPVLRLGKYLRVHWPAFCAWLESQKAWKRRLRRVSARHRRGSTQWLK